MNVLEKIVEEIESMKNDAYETLKEERKRHGASKTAEELESYLYRLILWRSMWIRKMWNERIREDFGGDKRS